MVIHKLGGNEMADFFGKVKDSFNKGVATVSTGSKNLVEKTKINSCIRTLEDEKKQLLELLGNKIYNYCKETEAGDIPRDVAISFCTEINNRLTEIETQKANLAALDAEMDQITGKTVNNLSKVCNCGHENAAGAKFCAKCGAKL